jgi:hypothetical protein
MIYADAGNWCRAKAAKLAKEDKELREKQGGRIKQEVLNH